MQLAALRVLHVSKKKVKSLDPVFFAGLNGFHVDTCQRWIWISQASPEDPFVLPHETSIHHLALHELEVFQGKAAYSFLIRVAAGLESQVLGETDIFGQIKEAWRKIELSEDLASQELNPWMARLFEDTKEIRTRYLQNLGGSSYGSLVRKMIKDQAISGPVFLVGAGKIAQSIAPFLVDQELWIWNRDPSRLCALEQELQAKLDPRKMSQVRFLRTPEEADQAWQRATHTVVCIPTHFEDDQKRIEKWTRGGKFSRSVIHLGGHRDQCQPWQAISRFYALDDLFSLQNSLDNIRSVQIAQAFRACEERAKLRALGSSLSIPHGWEDLACFA